MSTFEIVNADCLEHMPTMEAESIDSIVTDPPYGLSFMGKDWDHGIPGEAFWREAYRVAKPGAHLLAFGGTRTFHRLACAIEDAGWEIRDCVMWVYGSGFPKSLDVSKAIDRAGGEAAYIFRTELKNAIKDAGLNFSQIDDYLGVKSTSCYWVRNDHRACLPARHHWSKLGQLLSFSANLQGLYEKSEREVVGTRTVNGEEGTAGGYQSGIASLNGADVSIKREVDITAPATDEAKRWNGWGTALKPAWEPIIVARKPLIGTVAQNVLTHGTGAINIDGCRVEGDIGICYKTDGKGKVGAGGVYEGGYRGEWNSDNPHPDSVRHNAIGRFPANLIHDGSDEVMELFPNTKTGALSPYHKKTARPGFDGGWRADSTFTQTGSEGSAARYFYCAKASKADRTDGCERNHHPTVKPTELMRYLCRLVTPPDGIVLDPFTGSGSTGKGAILEGFRFYGIEKEAEYAEIAKARIEHAKESRGLFW
jgi:DNA modification methylase